MKNILHTIPPGAGAFSPLERTRATRGGSVNRKNQIAMNEEIQRRLTLGLTIQPPSTNRRRVKRRTSNRLTFQGWPYVVSAAVMVAVIGFVVAVFL